MKPQNVTEQHYILIGSNRYQILFDSKVYEHDILIRGLFHWDPKNISIVIKIDFILDNLSTVKMNHGIARVKWCSKQNRLEFHIYVKKEEGLRTKESLSVPEGFDLKNNKEMELVLRIYDEGEVVDDCIEFELPRPNEDGFSADSFTGMAQADKDGAILIGTTITKA